MKSLFTDILFTRFHARLGILFCSFLAATLGLAGPFFQKEFVDHLTQTPSRIQFFQFDSPLTYIFAAFLCILLGQAFSQATIFLSTRESLHMQRLFAQRLYDKTLHLRVDTMSGKPVGEIVQLYATDVPGATVLLDQTLPAGASTLFPLILAPFAISLLFDISLWPTIGLMVAITCLNTAMAFRQSRFFYNFKHLAGVRIGLVNEWIQNIRTIRILGWTQYFESNIFDTREVETKNRVSMVTNGQMMNAISSSVTFFLNTVAIGSLVYFSNHQITSGELLALLWIVGVFLTRPFRQMPWFFTFAFDAWTSIKRLAEFFETPNNKTASKNYQRHPVALKSDTALYVEDLNLEISGKPILNKISLNIRHGEFVAVVGEVGSGKSMLLLSLLGETGASFKEYYIQDQSMLQKGMDDIRSHYAYVPQEGFIMSATLRENVAFLYDIEHENDAAVEESLRMAQFDLTTERVEEGLGTEIGERGVNLSGGQRQRVGLARVHYHQAPIMLLDDCLSAVDVDTEEKLFEELLLGAWIKRTRILVTHRLSALHRVDRILFMQEGRILDEGTFEELLARNEHFRHYTTSVAKEAAEAAAKAQKGQALV